MSYHMLVAKGLGKYVYYLINKGITNYMKIYFEK